MILNLTLRVICCVKPRQVPIIIFCTLSNTTDYHYQQQRPLQTILRLGRVKEKSMILFSHNLRTAGKCRVCNRSTKYHEFIWTRLQLPFLWVKRKREGMRRALQNCLLMRNTPLLSLFKMHAKFPSSDQKQNLETYREPSEHFTRRPSTIYPK